MNPLVDLLTRTYRTLPGWQWLVLLAIPPLVILLYFLKLKRQPLEVPSTYLWHRTIEDLHVNSVWQRLRQNLLLFLQLLILALALLALLRPSWEAGEMSEERYVFMIDASASMSATDLKPTRLDQAKQRLVEAIDRLKSGSSAMIISFSDRAVVEQPFTTNRRLLKRRANAIAPTQRGSDLDEALRVAAGLSQPGRGGASTQNGATDDSSPATVMIFSDGQFRESGDVALNNLKAAYVPIGTEDVQNVGIVTFNAARNPELPSKIQLFSRLQNFGSQEATVIAELSIVNSDRQLLDATRVELPAGGVGGVEFTVDAFQSGVLQLDLQYEDDLPLDNRAFLAINPQRKTQVLMVSSRNDALELAIETSFIKKLANVRTVDVDYLKTKEYRQAAESGSLDLIIYDDCRPESMPQANTYFIGQLPPDPRWQAMDPAKLPQIIDTDQAHPLMRFVEMGDVMWIVNSTPVEVPAGGTVLVDSHVGPLLGIAPRQGFEDLVQAFPIVKTNEQDERFANTDWPIRVSFPVFLGNVVNYLSGAALQSEQPLTRPGQPVTIRSPKPIAQVTLHSPTGQQQTVQRDANNAFVFGMTYWTGVYEVRETETDELIERFAVNLFDPVESNIGIQQMVRTEYEDIQGTQVLETQRKEFWKYLLVLGLIVLMVEWYIYNRRVYI